MKFRFPSKTFLVGEYAVVEGGEGLLLGHGPHFESLFEESQPPSHPFHPESMAGKFAAANPAPGKVTFHDPWQGKGGFGGSGAEFLAAWSPLPGKELPPENLPRAIYAWNAWEDSRGLPGAGSGADVLVQAFGTNRETPFLLSVSFSRKTVTELDPTGEASLSLFHTGLKLPTHEQRKPEKLPLEELNEIVERAEAFLAEKLVVGFAKEVQAYGDRLAALGLQAPHTAQILSSLQGTPGVLAAKGCGAMGADVILVIHRGAELETWAAKNSLAAAGIFPV